MIITALTLCMFAILFAHPANATVLVWNNTSGGSWHDSSNWTPAGIPTSLDDVEITVSGSYLVAAEASDANARTLELGGLSGTQTLRIAGLTLVRATIEANGVLELEDGSQIALDSVLTIHQGGEVQVACAGEIRIQPFGCNCDILNGGVITKTGVGDLIVFGSYQQLSAGTFSLQGGNFRPNSFSTDGLVTLADGTRLEIWTSLGCLPNTTPVIDSSAVIDIQGTASLSTEARPVHLFGEIRHTGPDTGTVTLTATPECYSGIPGTASGSLRVLDGTLDLAWPFPWWSWGDSCTLSPPYTGVPIPGGWWNGPVQVDSSAELRVLTQTSFGSSSSISSITPQSGKISFSYGDWSLVLGTFPYSGTVNLDDGLLELNPIGTLDTLQLVRSNHFSSLISHRVITTSNLEMLFGDLHAPIVPVEQCTWEAGTIHGTVGDSLAIPPGSTLDLTSSGLKVLDNRDLNIEGTATMQDDGSFTLDSSRVTVDPGATLNVRAGFTMLRSDLLSTLINNGQSDFDPQGDTIAIDVPVTNSTVARTPGTIDILSAPVVFGCDGLNSGRLNLLPLSVLILRGHFRNTTAGIVEVNSGELQVHDTLWNESLGLLGLDNGALISGNGLVINGGNISSNDGLLPSTHNIMSASLTNLADSGFVNVQSDTLTVSGNVVNQGTVTIQTGAVLRVLGTFLNDVGGVINGSGILDVSAATSFVNNGTISPGMSPGTLSIHGNLNMGPSAVLSLELFGPSQEECDRMNISGSFQAGGTLALALRNGYVPQASDSIQILTCGSWSGEFAGITGTDIGDGQFVDLVFGPTGIGISVVPGLNIVILASGTAGQTVQLSWNAVSGATAYHIYSDSVATGTFSHMQAVIAPDTSLELDVEAQGYRSFFRVSAVLPD